MPRSITWHGVELDVEKASRPVLTFADAGELHAIPLDADAARRIGNKLLDAAPVRIPGAHQADGHGWAAGPA